MSDERLTPRGHLNGAGKMYPRAWKLVDEYRASRGQDGLPKWPAWCYLPMAGFYAIVSDDTGSDRLPIRLIPDVARLAALGTWRVTQGIYRFDPTVYESLVDTPINGDLPCDVFYRLPEWCVYIETPNVVTKPWGQQYGAWVHLEWDANDEHSELRILLDTENELVPLVLHLGTWSIIEALERFGKEAARQAGLATSLMSTEQINDLRAIVEPIVSLTVYLCSVNAEFGGDKPQRPKAKKTKKGWRLFPPDRPHTWDVAMRLGSAIRNYQQTESTAGSGTHAGPRPHIRRAHWHSFWKGSKDDPKQRRIIVKWMPPIPVNVDDEELPVVVRPIE